MAPVQWLPALLLLLLLVSCAAAGTGAVSSDPRSSLPGRPPRISHARWDAGRSYSYSFSSKAAHVEAPLPRPNKVNPQTALEDLGLWPFAVLEGRLVLSCSCRGGQDLPAPKDGAEAAKGAKGAQAAAPGPTYCQAAVRGVRHECGRDATRSGTTCEHLKEVAAELPVWPFGLVFSAAGELVDVRHNPNDGEEAVGIKQNLVADLGLAPPEQGQGSGSPYRRTSRSGNATVTTTYRVRPYTQLAHHMRPPVDGVMVVKRREAFTLPANQTEPAKDDSAFLHRRRSWVYMVIGGDTEFEEATTVPTRVTSTEEAQVNPAVIPRSLNTTTMFVLSRLELNLRSTGTVLAGSVPCPLRSAESAAAKRAAAESAAKRVAASQAFGSAAKAEKEAGTNEDDAEAKNKAAQLVKALNKPVADGTKPAAGAEDGDEQKQGPPAPAGDSADESSSDESSGEEEAPVRVRPGSFLEVDAAGEGAQPFVNTLAAFRSVADSMDTVMARAQVPAASLRPMADRVMEDTGAAAFSQMLDTEAANFEMSKVDVGPGIVE